MNRVACCLLLICSSFTCFTQTKTVARQWNEALLEGIRNDFARPTVHARNLFHISAAMYDAWAVFDTEASTYFLGNTVHGYSISFDGFSFNPAKARALQEEAISYAVYRLMDHRFAESPGYQEVKQIIDNLHTSLGYDISFVSQDYSTGSAAALGNYIAEQIKIYGYQDGANEPGNYENLYYEPVNEPLDLTDTDGANQLKNPNRWQPLQFETFVDQGGNVIGGGVVDFLSPEWGNVDPFSLTDDDHDVFTKGDDTYNVYHDPGQPPMIDSLNNTSLEDNYKWNFALVAAWSSHLDPTDGIMWDISPASLGSIPLENLPTSFENFSDFYDLENGGDISEGYELNPITNQPYEAQMVPRGDYARVLAEFWADGPDSETPPGHWFVILNYVMDQPQFELKWEGEFEMEQMEYEVKAYFTLGGTMHDVAISSWGIKGYYDYIRPVSAIRFMATRGQSTSKELPSYDSLGIPLIEGLIELIEAEDPLAGGGDQYVDEIKLWAWKGHEFVENTVTDQAGVGWIRAKQWWPYQRPSFVTPPFAGYVSGHSTYSRAAAEVLTRMTGSEYFPGGLGEFIAPKNEFLVFEEGPSQDVVLQWAKYSDASDQCSLSRIWGGIHPPADDIPGRLIGHQIGIEAFDFAVGYFGDQTLSVSDNKAFVYVYPNPAKTHLIITGDLSAFSSKIYLVGISGKRIEISNYFRISNHKLILNLPVVQRGIYMLKMKDRFIGKVFVRQ